jgi:hypothetical protein
MVLASHFITELVRHGAILHSYVATISGLLGKSNVNWRGMGIVWAVVVAIFGWALYSTKRERAKGFAALDTSLPDWIAVANDGIHLEGPGGATGFQPWNNYTAWREGKQVALLYTVRKGEITALPLTDVSPPERQVIRGMLESHLLAK